MSVKMASLFVRTVQQTRYFSTSVAMMQQTTQKHEQSRMRSYLMKSYIRYMNRYEEKLEKRFPVAMKMYKTFTKGIRNFFTDLQSFVGVRLTVISLNQNEGLTSLSRKEIELYHRMPKDMIKISPVLLFSAIPFSNYVILPLAFMYPHKLLTSHFWTPEQKEDYHFKNLVKRLCYKKQVFQGLNQYIPDVTDTYCKAKWCEIITEINIGKCPSVEKIIECKTLFTTGPYCLPNLRFVHMKSLLYLHGLSFGFHPTRKLNHRSYILREMDQAIIREGGVGKLNCDEVDYACFVRGFHTCSLTEKESRELLNKWLILSSAIDDELSTSLLLHGPVLLGYNIPCHFIKPRKLI